MSHITKIVKITLLSVVLASGVVHAQEVFSWKDKSGSTTYSDVPRNLKPADTNIINMRTQKVTPPASSEAPAAASDASLAEQQTDLNSKLAQKNKEIEENNKKIEAENREQKQADCKRAQLNRSLAETARVPNRDELLNRYNQDVANFCN